MRKKILRRLMPMLAFALVGIKGISQYASSGMYVVDLSGKPIDLKASYNINGSANYPEHYTLANLSLNGGKVIANAMVKIHLADHSVLYTTNGTDDMVAISSIEKIDFPDINNPGKRILFKQYESINDPKIPKKYYQVLHEGKIELLKLYTLTYSDSKDYGNATVTRTYQSITSYYVYSGSANKLAKITKTEDLLQAIPAADVKRMTTYLANQKVNVRKEADLARFYAFYDNNTQPR